MMYMQYFFILKHFTFLIEYLYNEQIKEKILLYNLFYLLQKRY